MNNAGKHGRQPFELNYFPLLIERIILSNKKKKFAKIFTVVFFKAFSKNKKIFGIIGPVIYLFINYNKIINYILII